MRCRIALLSVVLATSSSLARGQGPLVSYLVDPATELSWASCHVYLEGGSKRRISFLPLVSGKRAPLGTQKYTRDIRVDAPLVFVGDGIVRPSGDPYRTVDVSGKVVLLAYDLPAGGTRETASASRLEDQIREAASRNPAAIVAFSTREEAPFPFFRDDEATGIPETPTIVIGRRSAEAILAAGGLSLDSILEDWKAKSVIKPAALIARLDLRLNGAFAAVNGPHFTIMFQPGIAASQSAELAALNEKSVAFATNLFQPAGVAWRKSFVTYFRDFDAKVFYTHHWGSGLASDAGVFSVFSPSAMNFGLAVHENTHTLLGSSWGDSSSFFNEGLARYAESAATTADRDHLATMAFLNNARLFPLAEMVGIDIGGDPRTVVAYPAAGSFAGYLVATYGLSSVRRAYELEAREPAARIANDSWRMAFKRPLAQLEREWIEWLRARFRKR